jgi:phospho-N-acetylmuramoyl-pentapeptide-transferase
MLYKILYPLRDYFFGFNIFKYITFRAIAGCGTSFFLFMLFYPRFVNFLYKKGLLEKVKRKGCEELYKYHRDKEGIPTSGGILIIISTLISSILFCDISSPYVLLALSSLIFLGTVGYLDDISKVKKSKKGLKKRYKLLAQLAWGLFLGFILYIKPDYPSTIEIPFFKHIYLDIGILYLVFTAVVVIGTSNAVNLTDGLDGLAIGAVIIASGAFAVMAYITGNVKFSSYLFISYVPGAGELTVFLSSLIGASVGFLWYNAYPAEIFMGDSGALALGGAIATAAIIIKKELLLLIIGGLFVIETISVLIQIFSFRIRRKKVFYFAPIHHHFQVKGWPEPKIIVRFWIISTLFALLSLLTLKIR